MSGPEYFYNINSLATHQKIDCHHQLFLFKLKFFICCCKDVGELINKKNFFENLKKIKMMIQFHQSKYTH